MSIKADTKYAGTIGPGSQLYVSNNGTMAYQVNLECADGSTSFAIWLTEKNRERANKYFEIIGADLNRLKEPNYLEYELAQIIEGREVSFGTKEEEYQGNYKIKVSWIGKRTDPNLPRAAARYFGGSVPDVEQGNRSVTKDDPITDADIPF